MKHTRLTLDKWINNTAWDEWYWRRIGIMSDIYGFDGCTGVPDWFVWTCLEHDLHYHIHSTMHGRQLSKRDADYIFRRRIQQVKVKPKRPITWFKYPISWIRWAGVWAFGHRAWVG